MKSEKPTTPTRAHSIKVITPLHRRLSAIAEKLAALREPGSLIDERDAAVEDLSPCLHTITRLAAANTPPELRNALHFAERTLEALLHTADVARQKDAAIVLRAAKRLEHFTSLMKPQSPDL